MFAPHGLKLVFQTEQITALVEKKCVSFVFGKRTAWTKSSDRNVTNSQTYSLLTLKKSLSNDPDLCIPLC